MVRTAGCTVTCTPFSTGPGLFPGPVAVAAVMVPLPPENRGSSVVVSPRVMMDRPGVRLVATGRGSTV